MTLWLLGLFFLNSVTFLLIGVYIQKQAYERAEAARRGFIPMLEKKVREAEKLTDGPEKVVRPSIFDVPDYWNEM